MAFDSSHRHGSVDIDALIDEVEGAVEGRSSSASSSSGGFGCGQSKYGSSNGSSYKGHTSSTVGGAPRGAAAGQRAVDDIDALLSLVGDEDCTPRSSPASGYGQGRVSDLHPHRVVGAAGAAGKAGVAGKRRCGVLSIAGSDVRKGYAASSASGAACGNLRCTQCDFEVLCIDDCKWDDEVDYLFFRNNMPDRVKLKRRLSQQERGWCAYACQCSWRSVLSEERLGPHTELKWACGGH